MSKATRVRRTHDRQALAEACEDHISDHLRWVTGYVGDPAVVQGTQAVVEPYLRSSLATYDLDPDPEANDIPGGLTGTADVDRRRVEYQAVLVGIETSHGSPTKAQYEISILGVVT